MQNQAVFLKSLKPLAIEEFLDFYFYRRLAHKLVPWLIKWRLRPNQVTTVSLLCGLVAAFLALKQLFVPASALMLAAISLDCCDGQVARLTGQASPLGRIMDGFFDMIWIFALWLGIFFSDYFAQRGFSIFWLMFFSAASMIVHCWRFDGVKIKYLELVDPESLEGDLDVATALALARSKVQAFHLFEALLAVITAFHAYFFVRGRGQKKTYALTTEQRQQARHVLEPLMRKWSWLGEGHHNTLFLVGLLLAPVTPYGLIASFLIILVLMNLWWFWCEFQFYQKFSAVKKQICA